VSINGTTSDVVSDHRQIRRHADDSFREVGNRVVRSAARVRITGHKKIRFSAPERTDLVRCRVRR
jgi:hypothetical protein